MSVARVCCVRPGRFPTKLTSPRLTAPATAQPGRRVKRTEVKRISLDNIVSLQRFSLILQYRNFMGYLIRKEQDELEAHQRCAELHKMYHSESEKINLGQSLKDWMVENFSIFFYWETEKEFEEKWRRKRSNSLQYPKWCERKHMHTLFLFRHSSNIYK